MESKTYTEDEQKVIDILSKIDQKHLYENLEKYSSEERQRFCQQVNPNFFSTFLNNICPRLC